ncbi:MAG: PTS mannose/fructose/sorbose transporter subunit IIB [Deltaproteobacteria bacterium]|nr:PTS mannose/fructose/sorbose transporter subunit IIB [Deltaproteobacteria bacterium]
MHWFRIDNRLVHGQVIEAWLPHIRAKALVVANDDLAADALRQEIMSLAVPSGITFCCCTVRAIGAELRRLDLEKSDQHTLVLFATCADARAAHMSGVEFTTVNIGNLHYGPGKEQICEYIALGPDDRSCLHYFEEHGVEIDFRCVPTRTAKVNL